MFAYIEENHKGGKTAIGIEKNVVNIILNMNISKTFFLKADKCII